MTTYREITAESTGLFETCARHTARQTTRMLQAVYLCDDCTRRLVAEAFNNRPPVFHGETIQGYCGLCSVRRDVTMRQWFVCPICWNVVLAYQKSIAATTGLQRWWNEEIKPKCPNLRLDETEPVYLSPFARKDKTKKQAAESLSILDFSVVRLDASKPSPLFHIEQKTGPTSISKMSKFQLDVNDFNDIVGAMNNTGVPAYVIHVQATQEYTFPTWRAIVKGLWWADLFTMIEHKKGVKRRRGEDKDAVYFSPAAFKSVDEFPDELKRERYAELTRRLAKHPVPLL